MNIKFAVTYEVQEGRATADVVLHIPSVNHPRKGYQLQSELINKDFEVFEETLNPDWGIPNADDHRQITLSFYAASWNELEEMISEEIESAKQTLRGVLANHNQLLADQPDNKVIFVSL